MEINSLSKLIEELLLIKKNHVISSDQDYVILVTGGEGSGKSMIGYYLCYAIDDAYNKEQICFTAIEYLKIQRKLKKEHHERGRCLLLDEGGAVLLNRKSMHKANIMLIENFILCRAANMFHFICVPSIEYIDKYIREQRVRMVINCKYIDKEYFITNRYARVFLKPTIDKWRKLTGSYDFLDGDVTFGERHISTHDAEFMLPHIPDLLGEEKLQDYYVKKNARRESNLDEVIKELDDYEHDKREGKQKQEFRRKDFKKHKD